MPPPTRQPHDPFTDAPLRPTTSNTTSLSTSTVLRNQTSQHSLRSNASTASARTRQPRDLFAPSLSRRGTTPRYEDEVLADSDSEPELAVQRQRQTRRIKHGAPDSKYGRNKMKQDEERDFVNRKPDGSYLLGVAGFGETLTVPQMAMPKTEEEREQEAMDAQYIAVARSYFASGASLGGKMSKKQEEELESYRLPSMMRLREQVAQQLEEERWMYEPTGRGHALDM